LPRVAWDATVCIDALQKTKGKFAAIRPLLEDAIGKKLIIVVSEMAVIETVRVDGHEPSEQSRIIDSFFDSSYVARRAVDSVVSRKAQELRRSFKVGPADAAHVATAIVTNTPIFLTYDGDGAKTKRQVLPLDKKLKTADGQTLRILTPESYQRMCMEAAMPLFQKEPQPDATIIATTTSKKARTETRSAKGRRR